VTSPANLTPTNKNSTDVFAFPDLIGLTRGGRRPPSSADARAGCGRATPLTRLARVPPSEPTLGAS
jgi:hypothetical protein